MKNKFLQNYFDIEEEEEEKTPSSPKYITINGDKIPLTEIIPEPKLNLEAKVEKPVDNIDNSKHDKEQIILNIMLVVFIIILILILTNGVFLELQLRNII